MKATFFRGNFILTNGIKFNIYRNRWSYVVVICSTKLSAYERTTIMSSIKCDLIFSFILMDLQRRWRAKDYNHGFNSGAEDCIFSSLCPCEATCDKKIAFVELLQFTSGPVPNHLKFGNKVIDGTVNACKKWSIHSLGDCFNPQPVTLIHY